MIKIDNKSNNGFYVHLSCNDSLTIKDIPLLDTLFDEKGKIFNLQFRIIKPYRQDGIIDFQNFKTKNFPCKKDTLFLFFIKDSLIKSVAWDSIVNNHMYEFKLKYTEKDLNKNNWSITID